MRPTVAVALLIGLALRLALIFLTPINGTSIAGRLSSYNDEYAHGKYAFHILTTGSLPSEYEPIDAPDAVEHGLFENYQSPLYYWIVAKVAVVLNVKTLEQTILLGRFVNLVLYGAIVWLFLLIVGAVGLDESFAIGGVIFLSLSGVFVRFTSIASNDPLFWMTAGGILLSLLLLWRDGFEIKWVTIFLLFAIVGLYSKLTSLLFLPFVLIAFWRHRSRRNLFLVMGCALLVVMGTLPLWLRNMRSFDSVIPLEAGFGTPNAAYFSLRDVAAYAFRSSIFPWSEFWHGYDGLVLMSLPILYLAARVVVGKTWIPIARQPLLLASLIVSVFAFVWLNLQYYQAEGRYLFSAWPALAMLFAQSQQKYEWLLIAVLIAPYLLFIPSFPGA